MIVVGSAHVECLLHAVDANSVLGVSGLDYYFDGRNMFWKKPSEYACPMCGREPKMKSSVSGDGVSIYSFQCPRKHIGGGWHSQKDDAFLEYCLTLKKAKNILEDKK